MIERHSFKRRICLTIQSGINLFLSHEDVIYMHFSMCFNQKGDISALNRGSLKLEDNFKYLGSSVSSTENDINMRLLSICDRSYESKNEHISEVLLCTPSHRRASVGSQLELIYNSSVRIPGVDWKTCRKQWMTETNGETEGQRDPC